MKKLLSILVCFLSVGLILAQNKVLSEVEIVAGKKINNSSKEILLDSATKSAYSGNDISKLLGDNTNISFKSWGTGGLSVPVFRGTNANHTRVLWNDVPLNSPMNGQIDFSTIPTSAIQDIGLIYGGNSATYGSGAIGGVVSMANKVDWKKKQAFNMAYKVGSFGLGSVNASYQYGYEKLKFRTGFNVLKTRNDFKVVNDQVFDSPTQRLPNNELKVGGIQQEVYYSGKKYKINAMSWYSFNSRRLPGTLYDLESNTRLSDRISRNTIQFKNFGSKWQYQLISAFIYEHLTYIESSLGLYEQSISKNYFNKAILERTFWDKLEVKAALQNNEEQGYDPYYRGTYGRNNTDASLVLRYILNNKITFNASARQVFLKNKEVPLSYYLGGGYAIDKKEHWRLAVNISKSYSLPTLNDMYWKPGGNPDLLPEVAKQQEAALNYILNTSKIYFKSSVSANMGKVNDWINWLPSAFGYWQPQNFKTVILKGTELNLETKYKPNNKWTINLNASYAYTQSTNLTPYRNNTDAVNKQLIYVPFEKATANIGLKYKTLGINYNYQFNGFRYSSFDNKFFIKGYNLGHVTVSKAFKNNGLTHNVSIGVDNIWNTVYQSVAYYAMPPRNFYVQWTFLVG